MNKAEFRTVTIGLLLSWGVEILTPLIQTCLDFIMRTSLNYPLTHYLLWGYLPVVISGIYIGLSRTKNKVINGIVVGICYYFTFNLFVGVVINRHLGGDLFSFGYAIVKRGFICAIIAWSSYKIKMWKRGTGKMIT